MMVAVGVIHTSAKFPCSSGTRSRLQLIIHRSTPVLSFHAQVPGVGCSYSGAIYSNVCTSKCATQSKYDVTTARITASEYFKYIASNPEVQTLCTFYSAVSCQLPMASDPICI